MKKLLLILVLGLLSFNLHAADPKEGRDYNLITPAPPVGSGDEVEVIEFFMYTCPHCKNLDPRLQEWVKKLPDNVKFRHMPAMFGGAANLHAKNFFALQVMGEEKRLHNAWFKAIHEEKRRLRTQADINKFLEENGVDMNKFHATLNSFTVQTKANRAAALMRRYGVRSVPTLIVDGRYRIKNTPQVLENTDALIQKTIDDRKK